MLMKIKKLHLSNFRGYENLTVEFHSDLNVIIGKNDVGKSTLLDAMEIFFNNETVKIDISDLYVNSKEPKISIGISFEIDPDKEYLIDSEVKTNLKREYLLNQDKLLEIHKVWDCSRDKLTASSLKTYLKAHYPVEFSDNPLTTMKIADLRNILEEYKDKIPNYNDVKKNTSSIIRQALYATCSGELKETVLDLNKEDAKKIFDSLSKSEFPLFFLFQSDRANKDTDKEVQDPLKAITKQAINDVLEKLEEVKMEIERKAIEIGNQTLDKLREMSPEISNVLKPNITHKAWDTLFSFSFTGDDDIPINKRGSGIRRLILLNYFRAEAERKNTDGRNIIYAIEEPETSQHPNHQIMLIEAFKELSESGQHQIFLTTHTPEIAKLVSDENLILIVKEGKTPKIELSENKLRMIADTLGIMPYFNKLIICVEGELDRIFLLNINRNIPELNKIVDFEKEKIVIVPMQGTNLKTWVDRHYLKDSNIKEFHLYDRDKDEKYKDEIEKVRARNDGSDGQLTNKREIENYIHPKYIEEFFQIDCAPIRSKWDETDIPKFIQNNSPKGMKEKEIKRVLCEDLSKKMTKEDLIQIDAFDEIVQWHKKIKEIWKLC